MVPQPDRDTSPHPRVTDLYSVFGHANVRVRATLRVSRVGADDTTLIVYTGSSVDPPTVDYRLRNISTGEVCWGKQMRLRVA